MIATPQSVLCRCLESDEKFPLSCEGALTPSRFPAAALSFHAETRTGSRCVFRFSLSSPKLEPDGDVSLPATKYYSPRIDRDLVSSLYHAAKIRRVPMTRFASALVREGLARLAAHDEKTNAVIREELPARDPVRTD